MSAPFMIIEVLELLKKSGPAFAHEMPVSKSYRQHFFSRLVERGFVCFRVARKDSKSMVRARLYSITDKGLAFLEKTQKPEPENEGKQETWHTGDLHVLADEAVVLAIKTQPRSVFDLCFYQVDSRMDSPRYKSTQE